MAPAVSRRQGFLEIFLDALEEQDRTDATAAAKSTALQPSSVQDGVRNLPVTAPWLPDAEALASIAHQRVSQAACDLQPSVDVLQQQMTKLTESQEAVSFYYGQGTVVCEQMWMA